MDRQLSGDLIFLLGSWIVPKSKIRFEIDEIQAMKRVLKYQLDFGPQRPSFEEGGSPLPSADGLEVTGEVPKTTELTSWHQAWDLAYRHSVAEDCPLETVIRDIVNREVIATFSTVNSCIASGINEDEMTSEEENRSPGAVRWGSEKIGSVGGRDCFLNRNMSGYHWILLDGAKHEVPYRLNYLERMQDRYPNSPLAYGLEFAFEFCDRILPRSAH